MKTMQRTIRLLNIKHECMQRDKMEMPSGLISQCSHNSTHIVLISRHYNTAVFTSFHINP